MNSIPLLLYLADVSSSLSHICGAIIIISFMACMAVSVCKLHEVPEFRDSQPRKILYWVTLPCFLIIALTPSKETIYSVIALNVGKEVVDSDLGKKSLLVVDKWLDSQLQDKEQTQ